MIVILKNGDKLEVKDNLSASDLAIQIDLKKAAIAARVNGKLVDVSTELKDNDNVILISPSDDEALDLVRHSTSHIMAAALFDFDPDIQFAVGPSIENGFYYDIKSRIAFSIDELELIEERMKKIIRAKTPFEKLVLTKQEAIDYFTSINQPFKVEIIQETRDEYVTLYKIGDFKDLCRGPHLPNAGFVQYDAFKLSSVSGSYWRGDSSRDVLQRIYGTAFFSKKELKDHFLALEEAQARDHRRLGQNLNLFHFHESAPGNVFWLENGYILFNLVKDYITKVIKKHDYFLVQTPQMLNRSLWETSGHWEKFKAGMFVVEDEKSTMAIKPMSCPGHAICYKSGPVKSYRDLPVRMAEFGLCHRNESSGSLNGLLRVRAFTQDDAHIFCTPEQIITETQNICSIMKEIYSKFGFNDIAVKFSDRPSVRVGSDEVWDIAEEALLEAAKAAGLSYKTNRGEGAFYGPKLEFVLKDCIGRDWQCGTIQMDFVLPERFDLCYTDSDGNKKRPVMIHRALLGSLERFIAILVENYAGRFPFWLSPVQIAVASITEESIDYAKEVYEILKDYGFRAILDIENEKINYKIREHSINKVPSIVVVGNQEKENRTLSIRRLGTIGTQTIPLDNVHDFFKSLMNV